MHMINSSSAKTEGLVVDAFDFKSDLSSLMLAADLVITHCGAGSILEVLRLQKKAVGVINSNLMDNHQTELAYAMQERRLIILSTDPTALCDSLTSAEWEELGSYPAPDPTLFLNEIRSLGIL